MGYDENGIQSVILLKRHDDLLEIPWVYNADSTGKSFAVLIGTMQKKLDNILDSNARLVFGTCTAKEKSCGLSYKELQIYKYIAGVYGYLKTYQ